MKTKILLAILSCFSLVTFGSCSGDYYGSNSTQQQSIVQYTVTFETNGGSYVAPVAGTVYSSPSTTKSGYAFLGWYSDISLTNKVSFPFEPKSNTTLYAKWQRQLTNKEKLIQHGKITLNPSYDYGTCTVSLEYLSSSDKFRMTVKHKSNTYPMYYEDDLKYDFTFGYFGFGSGNYTYTDLNASTSGSFNTGFDVTYSNNKYTFKFNKTGLMSEQKDLIMACFQKGYVLLDAETKSLFGFTISA